MVFCNPPKTSAADVLDRLHIVFGVDTDSALAEVMKVNRQTLGSWRTRNRVPYEDCIKLAEERGLSLDWLLMGVGRMERGVTAETSREVGLLVLMRELPEEEQQALIREAQQRRSMRAMEFLAQALSKVLESEPKDEGKERLDALAKAVGFLSKSVPNGNGGEG